MAAYNWGGNFEEEQSSDSQQEEDETIYYESIPRFVKNVKGTEITQEQFDEHKAEMEMNVEKIEAVQTPPGTGKPTGCMVHYKASIEPEHNLVGLKRLHHFLKHPNSDYEDLGKTQCKLCKRNGHNAVKFWTDDESKDSYDDREYFVVNKITHCYYMYKPRQGKRMVTLFFMTEWKPDYVPESKFFTFLSPYREMLNSKFQLALKEYYKHKEEAANVCLFTSRRTTKTSSSTDPFFMLGVEEPPRKRRRASATATATVTSSQVRGAQRGAFMPMPSSSRALAPATSERSPRQLPVQSTAVTSTNAALAMQEGAFSPVLGGSHGRNQISGSNFNSDNENTEFAIDLDFPNPIHETLIADQVLRMNP